MRAREVPATTFANRPLGRFHVRNSMRRRSAGAHDVREERARGEDLTSAERLRLYENYGLTSFGALQSLQHLTNQRRARGIARRCSRRSPP